MIRKANNNDYQILSEYYSEFENNGTDIFELGPFEHLYVYEENKKVIAFINYSIMYDRAELNYIYVNADFRCMHIASELMAFFINDTIRKKCKNITLEVSENNISGICLYQKFGFTKIAMRKNYYKDGNGILMLKELISNDE